YCGTLADVRRLDLLLELARARPDLRIVLAGRGRSEERVKKESAELPNVDYLGWTEDPARIVDSARAIYYGLDPEHRYSELACPNTLYQALQRRKPLIFFCGGEPRALLERYRFGIRCEPSVSGIAAALDE